MDLNLILGVSGLIGTIILIITELRKGTVNPLILILLIIYFVHCTFFTSILATSSFVPFLFLLTYIVLTISFPGLFDWHKRGHGFKLLENLLDGIEAQGVNGGEALNILTETYCNGGKNICVSCNDFIDILINKIKFWCEIYYDETNPDDNAKNEMGQLASVGIISVAYITKAKNNKKGREFIANEIGLINSKSSRDEDNVIKPTIIKAREIISNKN